MLQKNLGNIAAYAYDDGVFPSVGSFLSAQKQTNLTITAKPHRPSYNYKHRKMYENGEKSCF